MLISPILNVPTIDKIHLKSFDFKMQTSNILRGNISLDEQGRTEREKYYFNSPTINLTVEPDRQGKDCLKVFFNPNKVEPNQVLLECRQAGIDFPILESQVIRADIERHQQLNQSLYSYHSIFHQATSGRTLKTTNNQSFRIGTGTMQIEIYDKSIQAKLSEPNIIRIESRYLKPNYLQKSGIYNLENLLNADTSKLMQLYSKPKDMYLSNLEKLQGNNAVEQEGNYIRLLEKLFQTNSRPGTTWLMIINLESIGIDNVLDMLKSANIQKEQRYALKKKVLKLASEMNLPQQESRVKEILSYFNLASWTTKQMETTLTMENLLAIFQAMDRIKPIDRSDYFNNYYQEIVSRLQDEQKVKSWIESNLKLTGQETSPEKESWKHRGVG